MTVRQDQTNSIEPRRIAVIVYEGFDELDVFGPYEVLKMAGKEGRLVTDLVGWPTGRDRIKATHGTTLYLETSLRDAQWDVVVVPGGGWASRRGAYVEARRGELPKALAELHASGATLASVCTGAMLLAQAGLTSGRPAITHPVAIDALRETGAEVVEARVVDDGDLITAGGITSGIDLGLWLVERFCGRDLSDVIAGRMQYQRVEDVHFGPRHK